MDAADPLARQPVRQLTMNLMRIITIVTVVYILCVIIYILTSPIAGYIH